MQSTPQTSRNQFGYENVPVIGNQRLQGGKGSVNPTPADIRRGIRASDLPYGEQALLGAILDHDYYGASDLGCIASVKTLAAELDTTERSINRMLAVLIKDEWVTVERSGKHRPLRMGKKCVDAAIRLVRLRTDESLTDSSQASQASDAPMTNPSCTHDASVLHPGPIGQPKRDSREGEEIQFAGRMVQPLHEEKPKPKPANPPKRMPQPPGFAKAMRELENDLASFGWSMSADDASLKVRPGFTEGRPLLPDVQQRLDRYRAHVAASGGSP